MPIRVTSEHELLSFDPTSAPACELDRGDVVSIETSVAILRQLAAGATLDSVDLERANAVTGPVFVRGAEPGDALRIEVLEIAIERAWVVWMEGFGPLGSLTAGVQVVEAPVADGRVQLGEQLSAPLAPMIGCIGVAPAEGTRSTVRPVYRTGGNLDLRELSPARSSGCPSRCPERCSRSATSTQRWATASPPSWRSRPQAARPFASTSRRHPS